MDSENAGSFSNLIEVMLTLVKGLLEARVVTVDILEEMVGFDLVIWEEMICCC